MGQKGKTLMDISQGWKKDFVSTVLVKK